MKNTIRRYEKFGELDLYYLSYFKIDGDTISYTDSFWENKPYAITGQVEEEEYVDEVKLKYLNECFNSYERGTG